jgi:hypothetical protein
MQNHNDNPVFKKFAVYFLEFAACGLNIGAVKVKYQDFLRSQGVLDDAIDSEINKKRNWYKKRLLLISIIGASVGYLSRNVSDAAVIEIFGIVLMYSGLILLLIQFSENFDFDNLKPSDMAGLIRKRK